MVLYLKFRISFNVRYVMMAHSMIYSVMFSYSNLLYKSVVC